jgi:hypothetical protein
MKTFSITCIDALNYKPTIKALEKTLDTLPFPVTTIYWFSDIPLENTKWIKINRFKRYTDEYNYITLKLLPHISTEDYNIIIHPDGFAVNKNAWDDEFLSYDYIGARWNNGMVGNGGFCLRSRKLYDSLLDLDVKYKSSDYSEEIINNYEYYVYDSFGDKVIPEDNIICKIYREQLQNKYGIRFAEGEIADKFSIEHNMSSPWLGKSLGFHGKHGIATHYGVEI